jgi:hypothetical protein
VTCFPSSLFVGVEVLANVFTKVVDGLVPMVVIVWLLLWSILIHEILTELGSSLVNTDSMTNHPSTTSCGVGKLATLHPSSLKAGNRVDCIK